MFPQANLRLAPSSGEGFSTLLFIYPKIIAWPLGNFLLKHPKLMDLSTSSVLLDKSTIMPSESRVYGQVAPKSFCQKNKKFKKFKKFFTKIILPEIRVISSKMFSQSPEMLS